MTPTPAPADSGTGTTTWNESILWSFGNGSDGQSPNSLIMDSNGNFFGTTTAGGLYGAGTVFELTASGQESVLWSFGNGSDGQYPLGVIIDASGNLYGVTSLGGANSGCYGSCGTAFELTPPAAPGGNWTETILWNFGSSATDGTGPSSGLIMDASDNLYGETAGAGRSASAPVRFTRFPESIRAGRFRYRRSISSSPKLRWAARRAISLRFGIPGQGS